MGVLSLILDAAEVAVDRKKDGIIRRQGDTIKGLKRQLTQWIDRATKWEKFNSTLTEELAKSQDEARTFREERNKARRECDECREQLIATRVEPAPLEDVDEVYPDYEEPKESQKEGEPDGD